MTLLYISFFAGILTVLSPCVLPLLPVIVGGSLAGGSSFRRALTVTTSLGVSVFLFTFLLKVSTAFINVPPQFWNWLSGGILFFIGILFLFPKLWDILPTAKANQRSTALMSAGFMRQNFWGDVIVGAALGPVFSTCSPTYFVVLASVLPVSIAAGAVDIFAYIFGLCSFLLVISFVGQRLLDKLTITADNSGWFKRSLGVLFMIVGVLIVTNLSATIEAPLYKLFDETKIEQTLLKKNMPMPNSGATTTPSITNPSALLTVPGITIPKSAPATFLTTAQKMMQYPKAPELVSPDAYLNTDGKPISIAQYRGKNVVLIDFWTYSCINCQRTLPYTTAWYQKYKDQGLVIIGVHTPEFAFERVQSNVATALKQFGITYPVVLDNEYKTWNAFQNQYWPREYLIDIDGYIVHDHTGEGGYDETESAIQTALAERAQRLSAPMPDSTVTANTIPEADLSGVRSPETYFGASRNTYLANGTQASLGTQTLVIPDTQAPNSLYLGGQWNFVSEYATNQSAGAQVVYTYSSKNVYFVASGVASGSQVQVFQDGAPIGTSAGKDVVNGVVTITGSRLYHLVANPSAGAHTLKLIITSPGLQAYTFTFG